MPKDGASYFFVSLFGPFWNRVLEQFLSSNIAERNELIESYIVGNRLFKFLSVVLPTHQQYFSSDPRLEELRKCSESQLMGVLECMEELELMIDEMEYNRYILKDLTPSEAKDNTEGKNITKSEMSQEDRVADENLIGGFAEINRIDSGDNNRTVIATKRNLSVQRYQERPFEKLQQKQPQQNTVRLLDESTNTYGKFDHHSAKVTVDAIDSSNQTQKRPKASIFDSSNHHKMLKQRVTAVVQASSKAEKSNDFCRPKIPSSDRLAESGTFSSPNNERKCVDSFPDMSFVEFQDLSLNDFEHDALFQDTPFPPNRTEVPKMSSEREWHGVCRQPLHEFPEDSQMSWDADFSQFNAFSEKIEGETFSSLKTKNTGRDPLLQDSRPLGGKQFHRPKPLPKIKAPPVPYPRSKWGLAQVQAARLSTSFGGTSTTSEHDTEARTTLSDCSSDIFYSIEDCRPKPEPVKTKIEERLERASTRGNIPLGDKKVSFALTQYENASSIGLEANSHRKLLNQFRGCVRFLLD